MPSATAAASSGPHPPPHHPSSHSSYPPPTAAPPDSGTSALPYRHRPDHTPPQPAPQPNNTATAAPDYNSSRYPALTPASPRPISEAGVNHNPGTKGNPNTATRGPDNYPPQQQQQPPQYPYPYPQNPYHQYPYPYYQQPPPGHVPAPVTTALQTIPVNVPLPSARAAALAAVKELVALRRQRAMLLSVQGQPLTNGVDPLGIGPNGGGGKADYYHPERANLYALREVEDRLGAQHWAVVQGLRQLQGRVNEVAYDAKRKRWRKFLVGGLIASIIPLVKKLWTWPDLDKEIHAATGTDDDDDDHHHRHTFRRPANRTEYAWTRSRRLVESILETTGRPGLGTLAFVVFAVLYIFTNEVTLRAARSVSRRLGRLIAKVEAREEVGEDDFKLLRGWRWRVVSWSE